MVARIIHLAERGLLNDLLIRTGIRELLRRRLRDVDAVSGGDAVAYTREFIDRIAAMPVASDTDLANEQHYEVPTAFFEHILGPHLKYSSCLYPGDSATLGEAEECMLATTCERAQLKDGQEILELGCGWGSLTLWMGAHYPNAGITAVTNSRVQAEYVNRTAQERGLTGVRAVRCDINEFRVEQPVDRIVSVEMFEHVRNYVELFNRIETWLKAGGLLFVHIFAHKSMPYLFETEGAANWMGRYFFSGGTMPSHQLLPEAARGLTCEETWRVNGNHYARTLEDWLVRLDRNRPAVESIFTDAYGAGKEALWINRWRIFLLACAELFAFADGEEWAVSHYRFRRPEA